MRNTSFAEAARNTLAQPETPCPDRVTGLQVIEGAPGLGRETSRTMYMIVHDDDPRTVDDLSFTSRDAHGGLSWWDVVLPRTSAPKVHYELGAAHAYELLVLIHNPQAEVDREQVVAAVLAAVACWKAGDDPLKSHCAAGFYELIGKYMATGFAEE